MAHDISKYPLSHMGLDENQTPPVIVADRAPLATDDGPIGTPWIDKPNNAVYALTSVSASGSNWELLGSPTAAVASIAGDTGSASPAAGVITVAGDSAQGSVTSATSSTVTVTNSDASTTQKGVSRLSEIGDVVLGTDAATSMTPASYHGSKKFSDVICRQNPILQSIADTGAAPVGTGAAVNVMHLQDDSLEVFNIGTQTIIAPRMDATGLLVSLDLTDNEGAEYNWGARANAKNVFTAQTDGFAMDWTFTLADVSGCDPVGIGIRKVEANNATLESYTDFVWIGVSETDNSGTISIKKRLNSGAVSTTNTTDAWADGEEHKLTIIVSAAGSCIFLIDDAAPSATTSFTFDSGDLLMPFFHGLHGTTSPGAWHWTSYNIGPAVVN